MDNEVIKNILERIQILEDSKELIDRIEILETRLRGRDRIGRSYLTEEIKSELDAISGKMTNPMEAVNDLIYGGESGTPTKLTGPSSGSFWRELCMDPDDNYQIKWMTRIQAFLDLLDTPSDYEGEGGKAVRVNSGEDALEFYTPAPDAPEPFYRITDDVYESSDGPEYTYNTYYTLVKEFTLPSNFPTQNVRVHFCIQGDQEGFGGKGRIYKNDLAVGTERIAPEIGFWEGSEDLEFTANDKIQIYALTDNGTYRIKTTNFRILGIETHKKFTITE